MMLFPEVFDLVCELNLKSMKLGIFFSSTMEMQEEESSIAVNMN